MNRLIPHRATYLHEAERAQQIAAQLQVDALLARVRQHDTSGCSDHDADETNNARVDWLYAIVVGTLVAPAVYYFAQWVLPVVWGAK